MVRAVEWIHWNWLIVSRSQKVLKCNAPANYKSVYCNFLNSGFILHWMLNYWCLRKFPKGVQKNHSNNSIRFFSNLEPFSILSRFRFKRYKAGCGFPRYFSFFFSVPSSISSVSWWGWLSSSFTATSLYRRYYAIV